MGPGLVLSVSREGQRQLPIWSGAAGVARGGYSCYMSFEGRLFPSPRVLQALGPAHWPKGLPGPVRSTGPPPPPQDAGSPCCLPP